jgi:hypothetical protein
MVIVDVHELIEKVRRQKLERREKTEVVNVP